MDLNHPQSGSPKGRGGLSGRALAPAEFVENEAGHRVSRKLFTFSHRPTACSSQTHAATPTTMLRIVLMLDAMGMNLLIRYKAPPTTIRMTTIFSNGIFSCSFNSGKAICQIGRAHV